MPIDSDVTAEPSHATHIMLILRAGFHMFAISIPIPPVAIAWAALFIVIGVVALAKGRSVVGWITATLPRAREIGVG